MGKGIRSRVRSVRRSRETATPQSPKLNVVTSNVIVLDTTADSWTVANLPDGFVLYAGRRWLGANELVIEHAQPIVVEKATFRCSCGSPQPCVHCDLVMHAVTRGREHGWTLSSRPDGKPQDAASRALSVNRYTARGCLVADGQVFFWGNLPTQHDPIFGPARIAVPLRFSRLHDIVEVQDGDVFVLARDRHGQVWCWQWEPTSRQRDMPALDTLLHPQRIAATLPAPATQLAVGRAHGLILDATGRVWSLGENQYGQLGLGADLAGFPVDEPQVIPGLDEIVAVAAGEHSSYALRSDGTVFSWGCNTNYQLGLPTRRPGVDHPEPVCGALERVRVTALSAGPDYVLALTKDGQVWGWGNNAQRQLAANGFAATSGPTRLRELRDVRAIAAGRAHALALLADGRVLAWGSRSIGELGSSPEEPGPQRIVHPTPVPHLSDVVAIAAGDAVSFAVQRDGTLLAWGRNESGTLALGKTSRWEPPTRVPGVRFPSPARPEEAISAP